MRSVTTRLLVAFGVLLPGSLAIHGGQLPADEPRQVFRSAVDVVTIRASVRDGRGRPMQGLTPRDFEVRDNGELRPMLSLRADLRSPVSLAILVDMSGSMRVGPKMTLAQQAFESVLAQLRVDDDEVALFTFDAALSERHAFTRDPAAMRDVLYEFQPFGTTSLYDATAETARRLAARTATHKAIILLTDGIDTSSTLTAAEVSGLAGSIDVPVYVVATVPSVDQRAMMERALGRSDAADLRDLAEWTGGHLLFASDAAEAAAAAVRLIEELRQQYVLAIEAAAVREWRRLDVRVRHPSAVVKARSGYFGG